MTRRSLVHLAWILAAILVLLHLDFWRPQRPTVYFGWLPEELAYRLGWMLLAWAYLEWFTRRVWSSEQLDELVEAQADAVLDRDTGETR
ncbi:MAG: hypothetical protein MPN21_23695 [Thermoanaerobaculia bacterium]|nr:hypothetical protein [Thermoanaerobaculia bacterium]